MTRSLILAALVLVGFSAWGLSTARAGAAKEIQQTLVVLHELVEQVDARQAELDARVETLLQVKASLEARIAAVNALPVGEERDAAAARLQPVIDAYRERARQLQQELEDLNAVKRKIREKYREVEDRYASTATPIAVA